MAKSAMIRVRTEPDVKAAAEKIFSKLGISASAAVNMFYRQVAANRGLPFEARLPNAQSKKAIQEIKSGKSTRYASTQQLFEDVLGKDWDK
jgi:DNA-damage-inducible protein J